MIRTSLLAACLGSAALAGPSWLPSAGTAAAWNSNITNANRAADIQGALRLDADGASARAGREVVLGLFALAAHAELRAQLHFEAALALDDSFDEAALQVRRLQIGRAHV